jgi:hypothetical protein
VTPLEEGSARLRKLYMITMASVRFEIVIPASERPQTLTFDFCSKALQCTPHSHVSSRPSSYLSHSGRDKPVRAVIRHNTI